MHSFNKIINILLFSLLVSLSLGIFIVFKPFTYIDNDKSKIICNKNNSAFDIGPNFIYVLDQDLDNFNDQKARKLCEHGIVRDYGNSYEAPTIKNYNFNPVAATNSGWGDALFMALAVLLFGIFVNETLKSKLKTNKISTTPLNLTQIVATIIVALVLFFLFLKKPSVELNCKRQIAEKVVNFRNSAFKGGVIPLPEEDKHIKTVIGPIYERCVRNN